jgi:hypothetical protein
VLVIGVLLILVAAAITVFALLGGGDPASLSWHGVTVSSTALGVFLTGALTLLIFELGLVAAGRGSSRGVARRRELARLRRTAAPSDAAASDDGATPTAGAPDGATPAGDATGRDTPTA